PRSRRCQRSRLRPSPPRPDGCRSSRTASATRSIPARPSRTSSTREDSIRSSSWSSATASRSSARGTGRSNWPTGTASSWFERWPVDRRERLARARLYVVTGARPDLPAFLDAVLSAGADVVQLREKHAEGGDLLRWSEAFRAAAGRHGALFIVNDRPDVALASGADGVHLGQNDVSASVARR